MKILLAAINAKYIHSNPAVYTLAAFAGMEPQAVEIREFTINQYKEEILESIYKARADVVMFSCYIWNIALVSSVSAMLKAAAPHVHIWLGGPEVSYDAPEFLKNHPHIEGIMYGEGEYSFKALAEYYVNSLGALENVPGIVYRSDGHIVKHAPAPPVPMDMLPFIYDDTALFEHKIIYYESSRGCPFSCSYCLSSIDRHVRFKSTALVQAELLKFLEAKVPQVKFVDRTFNCRHEHTMAVWQFIKDHDNGVTNFHFEITADLLSEDEIGLLASMRPGLVQLEIGVQSTCEKTLEEIRRVMDFGHLSRVVTKIAQAGNVHQHLDLIAGLPFETLERFKQSFNDVYLLKPQQLQLGFLKVLKGSWMYENRGAYGLVYDPEPVYEVIRTRWMSFDDILYLKGIESVLEIFYNSRQFEKSIAFLEHFFDTPFELYGALADFYEDRALNMCSHARMARYDHLLAFADVHGIDTALMKELLLSDLYGREHLKKRPSWAQVSEEAKAAAADFYNDSGQIERFLPEMAGESYRQLRFDTHLEFFDYDMEAAITKGEAVRRKHALLFNYRKRNPLTYEAEEIDVSR